MILAVAIVLSTTLKFASSLNLNTDTQDAFAKKVKSNNTTQGLT